jgi:hypothetical protein
MKAHEDPTASEVFDANLRKNSFKMLLRPGEN